MKNLSCLVILIIPICIFIGITILDGCGDEGKPIMDDVKLDNVNSVHFSLDYAEDIKSDKLFDTQQKRDNYKENALTNMDKLFQNFYDRFHFKPDHQIHVTIHKLLRGSTNIAYTDVDYQNGMISKLSMHFPYVMFDKEFVRAHELTHSFIAPFHLPVWVDEGFAVLNENMYTEVPAHPAFASLTEKIRKDKQGVNAIQNWTEGQGIYAQADLTQWCYRYSYTVVKYIEDTWPGTFGKVFDSVHPYTPLSTPQFVSVLDNIITDTDMVQFFTDIGFKL